MAFNHLCDRMAEGGLGQLLAVSAAWKDAGRHLTDLFDYTWFGGLLEDALKARPELAAFDAASQQQLVNQFQDSDRKGLVFNRRRLAHQHWESLPRRGAVGQMGTLRAEFEKRRRQKPIRQLIAEAGRAVLAIKPVFLMSPLSVAAFLPPGEH
ncbi:MAG: hypothetical protein AB2L07_13715 [Thermoanaerobaculaceae bacterium]